MMTSMERAVIEDLIEEADHEVLTEDFSDLVLDVFEQENDDDKEVY